MKNGSICVNAGIDHSNVEAMTIFCCFPKILIRAHLTLKEQYLINTGNKRQCDNHRYNGRAFRIGQTGAAIGCAGIKQQGIGGAQQDLFGRILEVKNEGLQMK